MHTCSCGTVVVGARCPDCGRQEGRSPASLLVLAGLVACSGAGGGPPPGPAETPAVRASPAEPADIYGAPPTADDDPEPIPEIDPGPAVEPVPEKPPVVRIEEQPASIYGGPPSDAWDEDPTIAPTKDDKKKKE